MRLVLDTSVLIASMRSRTGASNILPSAALRKRYDLLVTSTLLLEYEAVMLRHEHLKVAGWTPGHVAAVLDAVGAIAIPVEPSFSWRPALADPDDEMVLEAAVNGRADAIVTFNRRDFLPGVGRFSIEIIVPREAVRRLEQVT
jgi:putative PIN family toxin of toxin-antitoxin system